MPSTDTATASMDSTGVDGGAESSAPNEVRALSALAFDELRSFPGAIRDMHLGIAERAFRGVGPAALPVKLIHDAISSRAYGAIGAGASGLGRAVDAAMERRGIGEQVSLSTTQKGNFGIAVLNGLIGDRLERDGSALHQPASARIHGERIGLDEPSLREAFPQATPRLVVFIHGLTGDEFCWSWGQNPATNPDAADPYGSRLASDLGYTPVYLRYNSGLHISENGRTVAALLRGARGGVAGRGAADRAGRPLDGWTGGAQRCPSGAMSKTRVGSARSAHRLAWEPRIWAHPLSRAHTGPRWRSTSCPRRECWAAS